MASINDWAAKAAQCILLEYSSKSSMRQQERIAAIIALHAEPLIALLRESRHEERLAEIRYYVTTINKLKALLREAKREHYECAKKDWDAERDNEECTCGADAWNARIDAVLEGY